MINPKFSEEEKEKIYYERFHYPHPRVQQKMEVIWLKSQGETHQKIAQLSGIHVNTVTKYLKEYEKGGIEKLKQVNFNKPESELIHYQETIEEEFRRNPPRSIKQASYKIEEMTGIKRSPTQIGIFLKKIGMKCRKVGVIPSKADPEVQEAFKKKELMPRLEEAKEGKRAVFFVDAAHFVLGAFLGYVWCFTRLFIPSPSGRQRFNVLGAINAITHEFISITNDTYINSSSVCDLLQKLANLNLSIPITVVLDNARYQRCLLVQSFASSLGIELLFLPTYSPNLNLIERLWKFVKQQCLYSQYYSSFDSFKHSISSCLSSTHTTHKSKLDSLLSLRFQSFPSLSSPHQLLLFPPLHPISDSTSDSIAA